MEKLPTTPYGTKLGFTSRQQYLGFLTRQPRPLPPLPRPAPKLSKVQLACCALLWLVLAPLLLLGFLLVGERPRLGR